MTSDPVFPQVAIGKGMYESFYLRAVAPDRPVGAWIRYTVHKRPGQAPSGSLWCTVFDAERGAPFMYKHTTDDLSVPAAGWIAIGTDSSRGAIAQGGSDGATTSDVGASGDAPSGDSASDDGGRLGPSAAEGVCGPARWSLRISDAEPELRHLKQPWLYRAPLPRTKLTSPAPAASFDGTIELPDRTLELHGWRGMVGHNWGAEHAERWIWLHGIDFAEDRTAWLDVALGRVLIAGRLTPWMASGAISLDGHRLRLGGLGARGVQVAESPARCSLTIPGEDGLLVQAHVDNPPGAAAGWRYADPAAHGPQGRVGEHDVVNCSVAALSLNVRPRGGAATTLHTTHGAAYELGMRERDHGVPLAPFGDG
jgi:hypothetical protein